MERGKHLFQFRSDVISKAARAEAERHAGRESWWRDEYDRAVAVVKETAKVGVRTYAVSGGERVDLAVNYGDMAAYDRMQEAWGKMVSHRREAERFRMDAEVYGSQDRVYEMDAEDVLHYRLSGGPSEGAI